MNATEIAARAADLMGGDRNATHGESKQNFGNIAAAWSAYVQALNPGCGVVFQKQHVGCMMVLFKIMRTCTGSHNLDDYIDAAGYAALAGGLAKLDAEIADRIIAETQRAAT